MARLASPLTDPAPEFETIVGTWEGGRFSSPNDATYRSDGSLWFTDPPYGLTPGREAEDREIPFNGVYALFPDGRLAVVTDTLTRPNGIAFSPDGRTLYVANSDGSKARWVAYDVSEDGTVTGGRVLLDVTGRPGPGGPDGLEVSRSGVLFATGPGGVWIIHPDGTPLGRIRTAEATANVAFGEDGRSLFMTSDSHLLRIRVLDGA
jgi:gluconolactonase